MPFPHLGRVISFSRQVGSFVWRRGEIEEMEEHGWSL